MVSAFLDETGVLITVDHSNQLPVALVNGFIVHRHIGGLEKMIIRFLETWLFRNEKIHYIAIKTKMMFCAKKPTKIFKNAFPYAYTYRQTRVRFYIMLTIESLQVVCKTQNGKQQSVIFAALLAEIMPLWAINTQHRQAMFIAQCLHESGSLNTWQNLAMISI